MSNDPNQWIRDRGLGQFIPPQISSMTQPGNAGMNAKRAGSYTNTPSQFVKKRSQGIDTPGFDSSPQSPVGMTAEEKSKWMAEHGDSVMPSSTLGGTPPKKVPARKPAARPPAMPSTGQTLAQHVDGIIPPPVAKPTVQISATLSPEQQKFAETRARYDARDFLDSLFKTRRESFQGLTAEEGEKIAAERRARIEAQKDNGIKWLDSTPEDREKMTNGFSFRETSDLMNAALAEQHRRTAEEKEKIHAEARAAQEQIAADQRGYAQKDHERRMAMVPLDMAADSAHRRAIETRRRIEEAGRERELERYKQTLDDMDESPISKVFSRKNPFGNAVHSIGDAAYDAAYNTGKWFSERPGMQDLLGLFGD